MSVPMFSAAVLSFLFVWGSSSFALRHHHTWCRKIGVASRNDLIIAKPTHYRRTGGVVGNLFASAGVSSLDELSSNVLPSVKQVSDTVLFKRVTVDGESAASDSTMPKSPWLFVPGLDGLGNFSAQSFSRIPDTYDAWMMEVSTDDRTRFMELADIVITQLEIMNTNSNPSTPPPVLVGESFGGLLATYITSRRPDLVSKLVLINPATNFDETDWASVGPLVANTGPLYPLIGGATLLFTGVTPDQFVRIGQQMVERVQSSESPQQELTSLLGDMLKLTEFLPPETLQWRLEQWLKVGSFVIKDKFSLIPSSTPVLAIVGKKDRLLPSGEEGKRLKKLMVNTDVEVKEFANSGHAILDGSLCLWDIMQRSKTFREQGSYEVPLPGEWDLEAVKPGVNFLYQSTSPLYFSRSSDGSGRLVQGLESVPTGLQGRPVLLVGNHQLYGLDLALIIVEFLKQKETLVRGLAHPFAFGKQNNANAESNSNSISTNSRTSTGNDDSYANDISNNDNSNNNVRRGGGGGQGDVFSTFGAVEVSPMAIFQLMRINATVMLFPGGVNEAFHNRDGKYKLFWPEKTDFVRMAAMNDAIIVPFAAVGMADSVSFLADNSDVQNNAWLKQRAETFLDQMPQARAGVNETQTPPILAPGLPSRNYFLFDEPFDTRDIAMNNKTQCKELYQQVQNRLENAIGTLLYVREQDPYKDFAPRFAYERITGRQAPAPSLPQGWKQ